MKSILIAAAAAALIGDVAPVHRPSVQHDDPLIGVWGSETTFGPTLAGEMTLRRDSAGWRATLRSAESRSRVDGDSVRFAFADHLGEFRGTLVEGGREVRGFWIQPRGVTIRYPFATPVTLRRTQRDLWRGQVVPLPDRYSLYVSVRQTPGGALVAVFRNPEMNTYPRVEQYRVTRVGDSVIFAVGRDTARPVIRLAGTLDSVTPQILAVNRDGQSATANRQLTLQWPPLERVLVLSRLSDAQAIGLFPRVPRGLAYAYAAPDASDDGWTTASAGTVGFDEAKLAALVQRIADTTPTLLRAPLIHSLLVARHGKLVLEEYFYGHDREQTHDTRSAAKTFSSVMLGAAMMRGANVTPETPVASLLGDKAPFANPDPRKQRITLAHLMTHSSGLACDDNDDNSPGNENTLQQQRAQPDYWKYMLDLPMTFDPGAHYAYCSGTMNLMSGALTRATGTWLPALFDETIARPLQFGPYHYNLSPTLEGYLGGGAYVRPRDLLKIGQTYLAGGVWNGRRIVPRAWVARSTSKQIEWPYRDENVSAGTDGYAWHLNTLKSAGREFREYEANGNGGQLLMVIPDLDMVVVFTAGNYLFGGVWGRFRDVIVPTAIIPAIVR